jgi:hypothetical protein
MKRILILIALFSFSACASSFYKKEMSKTAKSAAASSRINATEGNSREVFKDIE